MTPRASYVGRSGAWRGAIKLGAVTVWTCEHSHPNRDQASRLRSSACGCAAAVLRLATMTDAELAAYRADVESYERGRWSSMSPRHPIRIAYPLSQRDAVRRALGLST